MKCLDDYYAKDSRYDRNSNITLEENSNIDIIAVLKTWIQEKELRGLFFYHIYLDYDNIKIHCEGYNTPSLCSLTIDISKLGIDDKLTLENQFREIAQENPEHIFIHISMNKNPKYKRKIPQ